MTQLSIDTLAKPCALTTITRFTADRKGRISHVECACGWKSADHPDPLKAVREWMDHEKEQA